MYDEYRHTNVKPGIGCKVAYDAYGHVVESLPLQSSDIPQLNPHQISGLVSTLDAISKTVREIRDEISQYQEKTTIQSANNTGTKVNVDANGHVVSVSDLLPEDIPHLPMDRIDGLCESLEMLRQSMCSESRTTKESTTMVPKRMRMTDLPSELHTRLNDLESSIGTCATQAALDRIMEIIESQMHATTQKTTPGTYTKVSVDADGYITCGDALTIKDIPEITTDDIRGLPTALRSKVDRSEISDLQLLVDQLLPIASNLSDILRIQSTLDTKTDDTEFQTFRNEFTRTKDQVTRLLSLRYLDMIPDQLQKIEERITSMEGRLNTLERRNGWNVT